jgi:hypothetical protein
MDKEKLSHFPHATLAALPLGQSLTRSAPAVGGAGAVASVVSPESEPKRRSRPTAEDRKRQKRLDANTEIEDLLDSKPSKSAIREFLLARVSLLLEDKGLGLT